MSTEENIDLAGSTSLTPDKDQVLSSPDGFSDHQLLQLAQLIRSMNVPPATPPSPHPPTLRSLSAVPSVLADAKGDHVNLLSSSPATDPSSSSQLSSCLPAGIKPNDLRLPSDKHLKSQYYQQHNFQDWAYHISHSLLLLSLSPDLFDPVPNTPAIACTAYHLL
jgi:hypothetical protein